MSKNLVLVLVGVIVAIVVAAVSTLIGIGSLDSATGIPIISGVVTLVLGALLALLDPNGPSPPASSSASDVTSSGPPA